MAVAQKALAHGLDDRRARESLGWRVLDWLDLQGLGLDGIEWITSPEWALVSLIIVGIWHHTPFMTLILLAGLQSLPQDPFEAARIDTRRVRNMGGKIVRNMLRRRFDYFKPQWIISKGVGAEPA